MSAGTDTAAGRGSATALALLVGLVVLVAYVDTTCRTVAAGDSGEYAAVVGVRF